MGNVGGISANRAILESIIRSANIKSEASVVMAKKAIDMSKEQGAEAVKLINSASVIKTNRIDIRV